MPFDRGKKGLGKAKNAGEALAMLDGVELALLAVDPKANVIFANRTAAEFFGRPEGSLAGASLHDLFEACLQHPFTFDRFYDRVSTTRKAGELEVPVHNFRWALFRLYPVESGMTLVIEDVTHRHIRDEPQRAALLAFNSLPEAVFLVYENGAIYYANDAACSVTGYTLDELKTVPASRIIPDLDPWVLQHNGGPVRESARFESVLWPKAGNAVPVEVCATGHQLFRKTNYIVSVRDITERKKAQAELVRLEEKTRDLLKRAPTGIYEIDFRGPRFVSVNDFVCESTGYAREELMAMSPFDLLADESKALFQERIRRQLAGEPVDDTVEYRGRTKDGQEVYWLLKVMFTYESGRPKGAIVVGHDVTERRRAEEALREAKTQAELYLDLMGHDINNMHQIALGYLELARNMPPDVQNVEYLDKSMEVLQRSAQLIKNVRKLQMLEEGTFKEQDVDVAEALVNVQREFGAVPHKTITLNLNGCQHCHVRANELLQDVFANLVSNAIKHTGNRADIVVDLDIVGYNGGRYCRVMVEDDGPGIPDDFKARIFNRVLKGTDKAKGMGLGLYLVKSLVASYGGRVWVEDRVMGDHTKGTRFVVLLPAIDK